MMCTLLFKYEIYIVNLNTKYTVYFKFEVHGTLTQSALSFKHEVCCNLYKKYMLEFC